MSKVAFCTRSTDSGLSEVCKDFTKRTSIEKHYFFKDTDVIGYIEEMLKLQEDYVINIDEDAFLFNPEGFEQLLQYFIQEDFVYGGMPDSGISNTRKRSVLIQNMFFNIFNLKILRPKSKKYEKYHERLESNEESLITDEIRDILNDKNPVISDEFKERYYGFFAWMINKRYKGLYLGGCAHLDDISTILYNQQRQPILLHTWYGRKYNIREHHTRRIDNAIQWCRSLINR